MNIAIDLDGVLFDTESWFMTYANIFNLEVKNGKVKNKNGVWVQDRYNWNAENTRKYIEDFSFQIEEKAPLMPLAKEVMSALEKKHKLFVITSRGNFHESEQQVTLKRFKKEKLEFDKILFKQHSKVQACIVNKIDLMIDDYPKNAIELAENGIKCFYFRDLTNKKVNHENVTEVRNWGEIAVELIKIGIIDKQDIKIEI